jgi:transcriptional regulator with XRE-family HTH domain
VTFKEAFGERLLVARFNCGRISQEAMAERAEMHRTQISLIETGQRMPLLETFVRLAGAVEQTPGQLLGPIRWVPGLRAPGSFYLGEDA